MIINCLALLCVIPTAIRWRREREILKQLQGLASRLQLSTPQQQPNTPKINNQHVPPELVRQNSKGSQRRRRRSTGVDNPAFIVHESQVPFPYSYGVYGSQNEFNASIFGLDPSYYIGSYPPANGSLKFRILKIFIFSYVRICICICTANRTRSLLDLRNLTPAKIMPNNHHLDADDTDGKNYNSQQNDQAKESDPIYYTISSDKGSKVAPLRNCVSLENLGGITTTHQFSNNDPNIMTQNKNYDPLSNYQGYVRAFHSRYPYPTPQAVHQFNGYWNWATAYNNSHYGSAYLPQQQHLQNPYITTRSNTNSKQSLGSDDYRRYKDVAL